MSGFASWFQGSVTCLHLGSGVWRLSARVSCVQVVSARDSGSQGLGLRRSKYRACGVGLRFWGVGLRFWGVRLRFYWNSSALAVFLTSGITPAPSPCTLYPYPTPHVCTLYPHPTPHACTLYPYPTSRTSHIRRCRPVGGFQPKCFGPKTSTRPRTLLEIY